MMLLDPMPTFIKDAEEIKGKTIKKLLLSPDWEDKLERLPEHKISAYTCLVGVPVEFCHALPAQSILIQFTDNTMAFIRE